MRLPLVKVVLNNLHLFEFLISVGSSVNVSSRPMKLGLKTVYTSRTIGAIMVPTK